MPVFFSQHESTFEHHCRLLYREGINEIPRQDIIAVFEERVEGGEILWGADHLSPLPRS